MLKLQTWEYDEKGNVKIARQNNNEYYTSYKYDEDNNKTEEKRGDRYGGISEKITYIYENRNLIKIMYMNRPSETFAYDENNNKIKYEDNNGYSETFTYNNDNLLISIKDSNGYWSAYKYNSNNQIIEQQSGNSSDKER